MFDHTEMKTGKSAMGGYCQLKPDLAPVTRGTWILIPDKLMDYGQVNCLLSVQFALS